MRHSRRTLENLFRDIPKIQTLNWNPHKIIQKITADSRAIEKGDLFVACRGSRMDGHDFMLQAIYAGASVIVCEQLPDVTVPSDVTMVLVRQSSACFSELLLQYYDSPDQAMKLVGITGTNGKTTIAYLLYKLLLSKTQAAYLGTLSYEWPGEKMQAPNTTPGPEVLIPFLSGMREAGVRYVAMEVSSHALDQFRVQGLKFEVAVFTQLTQDHLDYHGSLESYFQAKRKLFAAAPSTSSKLINKDCSYGRRLLEEFKGSKSFSLKDSADYFAKDIKTTFLGSTFVLCYKGREEPFSIRLPLRHNVANVLCVLGTLDLLGLDPVAFRDVLGGFSGIPGRFERVEGNNDIHVFVDYAHTPDAFENVLSETKKLTPKRILTMFGCGGDRDRQKRPLMAASACRYSDVVVITTDNPRSEDPGNIAADINKGIDRKVNPHCQIHEILDRETAIGRIIAMAEPGDVVLLLGKGHEDYQILGDRKIPFDDRVIAQEAMKRQGRVFTS